MMAQHDVLRLVNYPVEALFHSFMTVAARKDVQQLLSPAGTKNPLETKHFRSDN
jgi:hypothetical protein